MGEIALGRRDQGGDDVEWGTKEGGKARVCFELRHLTGRRASDQFKLEFKFVFSCALFCKHFHTLWA